MDHQFDFTYDWISSYFPLWDRLLPRKGVEKVLEVGCYEGRATTWFLQRWRGCHITAIDTFEGGHDHKAAGIDFTDVERRFRHNTAPWAYNVWIYKGKSWERLIGIPTVDKFDVALIDGSHMAADVLGDIVLTWPLLATGGTLILDDYGWGVGRPPHERPDIAIEAFLQCFAGQYELLEKGYQVIVRKLPAKL